jgi:hypothetical protein
MKSLENRMAGYSFTTEQSIFEQRKANEIALEAAVEEIAYFEEMHIELLKAHEQLFGK